MVKTAAVDEVRQPDKFIISIIVVSGAYLDGLWRVPVFGGESKTVGSHGDVRIATVIQVMVGNSDRYRAGGLVFQLDGVGAETSLGNRIPLVTVGSDEFQFTPIAYLPGTTVPYRYGKPGRYIVVAPTAGRVRHRDRSRHPTGFEVGGYLDGLGSVPILGREGKAAGGNAGRSVGSDGDGHGHGAGGLRRQSEGVVDGIALGDIQQGSADGERGLARCGRRQSRRRL